MPNTQDLEAAFGQFFESPRPGQLEAVEFILDAFESGKRVVMLEAPTGSGKSGIGLVVSSFMQDFYYLTITKILQTQLIKDYAPAGLIDLKGRNAYPCTFYKNFGKSAIQRGIIRRAEYDKFMKEPLACDAGFCRRSQNKSSCISCLPKRDTDGFPLPAEHIQKLGKRYSACPYYERVFEAIASPRVLMNFSSFLFQYHFAANRFGPRELLIVDEAHQTESQLMSFVSLTINDALLRKVGITIPDYDDAREYALWFHDNEIAEKFKGFAASKNKEGELHAEDEYERLAEKVQQFISYSVADDSEWIVELRNFDKPEPHRTLTLRPVFVHQFANQLIFNAGQKILLMSATILDDQIMSKSLGIYRDEMAFYRMPSTFPKENRPIHLTPVAKMVGGKDGMRFWGPELVKGVDTIVSNFNNRRGIIHTHNFAISKMVMEQCKTRGRFLYQENFENKEKMLAVHADSKNSVIVAPAMHEGLDLRDSLSRFQIICKVPYPNFFDDIQLSRRVEMDRRYLIWLTALKLVQSYGRSVRSETDWAHTFILDAQIFTFLKESHKMLPDWFKEAVVINK